MCVLQAGPCFSMSQREHRQQSCSNNEVHMWNAAHFLGILALSSESEGRKGGLCRKNGKANNNSLKSLMLGGSTGQSCKCIMILFVCCGSL